LLLVRGSSRPQPRVGLGLMRLGVFRTCVCSGRTPSQYRPRQRRHDLIPSVKQHSRGSTTARSPAPPPDHAGQEIGHLWTWTAFFADHPPWTQLAVFFCFWTAPLVGRPNERPALEHRPRDRWREIGWSQWFRKAFLAAARDPLLLLVPLAGLCGSGRPAGEGGPQKLAPGVAGEPSRRWGPPRSRHEWIPWQHWFVLFFANVSLFILFSGSPARIQRSAFLHAPSVSKLHQNTDPWWVRRDSTVPTADALVPASSNSRHRRRKKKEARWGKVFFSNFTSLLSLLPTALFVGPLKRDRISKKSSGFAEGYAKKKTALFATVDKTKIKPPAPGNDPAGRVFLFWVQLFSFFSSNPTSHASLRSAGGVLAVGQPAFPGLSRSRR